MTYGVVFENADDGGVGAYIPDLPGIGVVGKDHAEARAFIDQAVEMYVESVIEDGDDLPPPSTVDPSGPVVRIDQELVDLVQASRAQSR